MDAKKYKCKLIDTGNNGSLRDPQFALSYKSGENCQAISYNIISALKENNDVIIEVNSSYAFNSTSETKISPDDFLREIRRLNLKYFCKDIYYAKSQGFLFTLLNKDKEEKGLEILVYVPNEVWQSPEFYKLLPDSGVRYYIVDGSADSSSVFDDMNRLQEEDKINFFRLILFDISYYNHMGIVSRKLSANNIRELLGMTT